jgi:hypothetical protein
VRIVVLAAAVALAVAMGATAAAKPAPPETAAGFLISILKEEIHGQWARQWDELHPGHRALITRSQYVACSRTMGTDFATGKEIFRVLEVRNEPIHVRGVPQRTSKLVTVMFHEPGKANGLTYRLHAVAAGGRWTWIFGHPFLDKLAAGRCLDGSPLAPDPTA